MTAARWIVGAAVAAVAVLPSAGRAAVVEDVVLQAAQFAPARVEIAPGDSVRWIYRSGGNHTLTFEDKDYHPGCASIGSLIADCFDEGDPPITRTFSDPGEYAYRCKVHPEMTGLVVVAAPASTAPPTTTTTRPATTTTTRPATTTTARPLATSSTVAPTTTTTGPAEGTSTTIEPNEPPDFDPDGGSDNGDGDDGTGTPDTEAASAGDGDRTSGAVPLIVAALLGVATGGGLLLWRLRPGRGG